MTMVLQWVALAACAVCTAWRLPAMLKGRNRGLFWAFAMASVSVALSIPAIYLPVDGFLGGANLANVMLRLSLFAVFFLLAGKVAAAYKSPLAYHFVRGPVGLLVLVASSLGIWITYFLSELQGSSTGLAEFGDQPSVAVYMWIGRSYTAYAAAVLVLPTARAAVLSNRSFMDRAAAACLSAGFFLVCLTVPLQALSLPTGTATHAASFGSILFVAAGLSLVWLSFIRHPIQGTTRV
ncbi:hypothetical protein AAGW05_00850 [Arthrobacter sp. LAPM80]|uniref:hypothetical protein n=1 Tax=Arthrobacter sp. LAPM80 TaxID=3141788 RepID=UPI00398B62A2